MGIDLSSVWTGTIHQFCMHFIIRPYSLYSERLRKGYTIIDEYVTEQRYREATSIVGKKYNQYESPDDPEVRKAYHALLLRNKEIDFDLILELALDMVQKCPFICENIAGMIRSIHVDEYQDTKESQYQILAAIIRANRAINLLFVGDVNQLIYRSLGSVAKSADEIRQLYPLHFEEKVLDGCYRSSQRIIDLYSNFEVQKTGATAVSDGKDAHGSTVLQTCDKGFVFVSSTKATAQIGSRQTPWLINISISLLMRFENTVFLFGTLPIPM